MSKTESSNNPPRLRGMFSKFLNADQIKIVEIMIRHGLTKAQIFEYFSKRKGVGKPHWSKIHEEDEGKMKWS